MLTFVKKNQENENIAERGYIALASHRCCQGRAGMLTLMGKLSPKNEEEICLRIRRKMYSVNAALIDVTLLDHSAETSPFMLGAHCDTEAVIILLVNRTQRLDYEPYMQELTRRSQIRMIFTIDQVIKAREWLNFFSRLEIPR